MPLPGCPSPSNSSLHFDSCIHQSLLLLSCQLCLWKEALHSIPYPCVGDIALAITLRCGGSGAGHARASQAAHLGGSAAAASPASHLQAHHKHHTRTQQGTQPLRHAPSRTLGHAPLTAAPAMPEPRGQPTWGAVQRLPALPTTCRHTTKTTAGRSRAAWHSDVLQAAPSGMHH
jgi:hypothetical protein